MSLHFGQAWLQKDEASTGRPNNQRRSGSAFPDRHRGGVCRVGASIFASNGGAVSNLAQ